MNHLLCCYHVRSFYEHTFLESVHPPIWTIEYESFIQAISSFVEVNPTWDIIGVDEVADQVDAGQKLYTKYNDDTDQLELWIQISDTAFDPTLKYHIHGITDANEYEGVIYPSRTIERVLDVDYFTVSNPLTS